jgi:hypothetical protein
MSTGPLAMLLTLLNCAATSAAPTLVGPDDTGVYLGRRDVSELPCVSPVQTYLDLQHLPERADDDAQDLRDAHRLWTDVP